MTDRRITVADLAHACESAQAPALFDVRDPVEYERGHIDGATSLPRRLLEFRIAELVRDRTTPLVVCDGGASGSGLDDDVRADLAAETLRALGYRAAVSLDGGLAGWREAGLAVATGMNVPAKAFGERVAHASAVPSIAAATLSDWQREGRRIALCDVRTPAEHTGGCIPDAVSAPSFDIALHAVDLVGEADAVVVHCAGRTRSIIAAQTLIELGLPNVFALEDGTMGWHLAGLPLERGSRRTRFAPSAASRQFAELGSSRLARAAGVRSMEGDELAGWLAGERNFHAFDVRSLVEHEAGHIAGCIALPGGQAVQRIDDFVAVGGAPIVLVDEDQARANLAATWLRRMGHRDVSVLAGGLQAWRSAGWPLVKGRERRDALGAAAAHAVNPALTPAGAAGWLAARPEARVLHVDTSVTFRRGHVPGALWLQRGWLEPRIEDLAVEVDQPLLLTCVDGSQAVFAAATLRERGYRDLAWLIGGTRAWAAAGQALETSALGPQDDELLAPYQRGEQAMRDYLAWEKLLAPGAGEKSG